MKLWLDCEFHEDGKTIELISIGLVREDGQTFYAEADWYDWDQMTPWLAENVKPHLRGGRWLFSRDQMQAELMDFCGESPEFWGWYGSYDWVCLCQIFGTMMDLPSGWPMFIREAMQLPRADKVGEEFLRDGALPEHNALADAMHQHDVYRWLTED